MKLDTWEDIREEFMSSFTSKERAEIDANVKELGRLLDARDAGRITRVHFNLAVDRLTRSVGVRRRRSSVRARVPRVAF